MSRFARRKSAERPLGVRFFIQTEGAVTEREYLHHFRESMRMPKERVVIRAHCATNPLKIVDDLIACKKSGNHEEGDQFWAVFDVDEHRESDLNGFNRAIQRARIEGIQLALTSPSFEYWLLSHFEEATAYVARSEARSRVRYHLREYEKSIDDAMRDALLGRIDRGISFAERLERRNAEPGRGNQLFPNPSTSFHRLLNEIRLNRQI